MCVICHASVHALALSCCRLDALIAKKMRFYVHNYIFDVSLAESSLLLLGSHAHYELSDCQMWWKTV